MATAASCKLLTKPKNPHCLNVTWKKAGGPVTGYRIYCYPGDSKKPEIIKDIQDGNIDMVDISGLKPETEYRVEITSVFSGIESSISEGQIKMRKYIIKEVILHS